MALFQDEPYARLQGYLRRLGDAAVAFSGGVDSSFLLAVAKATLGERVLALTVVTPYIARWEVAEAQVLARHLGVCHRQVVRPLLDKLEDNPPERCYLCKQALFSELQQVARTEGFTHLLDGTNRDDLADYRPGLRALQELGIQSPLAECGLTKADIRRLSRELQLPTWDKPAYACLLTRLPHGTRVTEASLRRIEQAERLLMERGFRAVRVRSHGELARIEVESKEQARLLAQRETISQALHALGFRFVTLDLEGYRTGSMNRG